MKTRITELLGVQYPLLQGAWRGSQTVSWLRQCPMPEAWVSSPEELPRWIISGIRSGRQRS